MPDHRRLTPPGFSLLEATFALGLLSVLVAGIAPMFVLAARAVALTREQTMTASLAASKMEQLLSLPWTFDADPARAGAVVSDLSTDLSVEPPSSGGRGLEPSPADSLTANAAGYCDFLDRQGRWLSAGPTPHPEAAYVRRWQIAAVESDPAHSRVLQVVVSPVRGGTATRRPATGWLPGETRLAAFKTRARP